MTLVRPALALVVISHYIVNRLQIKQGNTDLIAAAKKDDLSTLAALLRMSNVDKDYQDEVG